jgi:hypothetical protein
MINISIRLVNKNHNWNVPLLSLKATGRRRLTPRSPPLWALGPSPSTCRSGGRRGGDLVPSVCSQGLSAVVCHWGGGTVGAASEQINLSQLHSHTGGDLHGGVSEFMATCACRSLRLTAWSSRCSSNLGRSVSRRVAGGCCFLQRCWGTGRGRCTEARMLVQRWWICRFFPTSLVGCDGSWFTTSRGCPPVDVPQRHVSCCLQQTCSSTHKALLAMVLLWIWQWWRLDVSSNVCLNGVGCWRRPLASVSAENSKDSSIFFYLLGIYLQSF